MDLDVIDKKIIHTLRAWYLPFSRIALFVVFFWFGILKILDTSPANPLVMALEQKLLPFLGFHQFIVFFSIYEMLIGITFLIPGLERLAIGLLALHMPTTFMPLVFLAQLTWQKFLTPTLEGQYIFKNLIVIALALGVAAQLVPWTEKANRENKLI